MRKRLLSLLLAFVLVLGMIPVAAFAEEIPFSVTLNDVALEIAENGTYTLEDYGVELPAYKITVPADAAEDAPNRILYNWLLGEEGQRLVAHEGYVSIQEVRP